MRRGTSRCSWVIARRTGGRARKQVVGRTLSVARQRSRIIGRTSEVLFFIFHFRMSKENSIREMIHHYGDADESSRLRSGWFQLEHARTQELILRHLPPAPATIIDAGGGAGAY